MVFDLDWCSKKAKCLTDTIFEITSPTKVDKFRPIHIDDKFWWIDSNLRAIVDFWIVDFSASTRCMFETSSREKSIKFSC